MMKLCFGILLVFATGLHIASAELSNDGKTLVKENTATAVELYQKLSPQEGNLFFSPYSLSVALSMTYGGARGDTQTQMAHTLHFSLLSQLSTPPFAELDAALAELQKDDSVTLGIANSLWPSADYKLLEPYTNLLKTSYGASVTPVDYKKTEEARTTINRWVEAKTQNKIKNLIRPNDLSIYTRLTLVNAIYFKGAWNKAFDPAKTHPVDFHVSPNVQVIAPMMELESEFAYAELDSLQALELPYKGEALSMLILLPKESVPIKTVESQISVEKLAEWKSALARKQVKVSLPKFTLTWGTIKLNDTLKAMGMINAFELSKADFSGMSGNSRGLAIGAVLHKAFVEVNEEGTEAAAATAVVMVRAAAMEAPTPTFKADRPFLFLIQDNRTGTILFMGRVTNPVP